MGRSAFSALDKVNTILLPNSLTTLSESAFFVENEINTFIN